LCHQQDINNTLVKLTLETQAYNIKAIDLAMERDAHNVTTAQLQNVQSNLRRIWSILNTTQHLLSVNITNHVNGTDPPYSVFKSFYENDSTHFHPYVNSTNLTRYICINFAHDFRVNASKVGIRCALVLVYYNKTGHAIDAVNTTDKGMIYIDPQNNEELVAPVIGQPYDIPADGNVISWITFW